MSRRKTPTDYHALAKKRGFKWLGPEVSNVTTKTNWQCSKGHTWKQIYNNISAKSSDCPKCYQKNRTNKPRTNGGNGGKKIKQDYIDFAKNHNVKWIGQSLPLPTVMEKTTWQCKKCQVSFSKTFNAITERARLHPGRPICVECYKAERGLEPSAKINDSEEMLPKPCAKPNPNPNRAHKEVTVGVRGSGGGTKQIQLSDFREKIKPAFKRHRQKSERLANKGLTVHQAWVDGVMMEEEIANGGGIDFDDFDGLEEWDD